LVCSIVFLLSFDHYYLLVAGSADAAEFKLVGRDREAGFPGYLFLQFFVDQFVKIKDLPAFCAPEVVVIILSAFVSADGAAEIKFRNLTGIP
jgi:hypothetical protein